MSSAFGWGFGSVVVVTSGKQWTLDQQRSEGASGFLKNEIQQGKNQIEINCPDGDFGIIQKFINEGKISITPYNLDYIAEVSKTLEIAELTKRVEEYSKNTSEEMEIVSKCGLSDLEELQMQISSLTEDCGTLAV